MTHPLSLKFVRYQETFDVFDRFSNTTKLNRIIVIGGGRWGRVWAEVACQFLVDGGELWVMSEWNTSTLEAMFSDKPCFDRIDTRVINASTFNQTKACEGCNLVVVASATRRHSRDARFALENGYNVMVEKPIALSCDDAYDLLNLARQKNAIIATNRHLAFASYLHQMRQIVVTSPVHDFDINIVWCDPAAETRYGNTKRPQYDMSLAQDVYPHIFSILEYFTKNSPNFENIIVSNGGQYLLAEGKLGKQNLAVRIERDAKIRRRYVELSAKKSVVALDFATEPGVLTENGSLIDTQKYWEKFQSPLALSLGQLISIISGDKTRIGNVGCDILLGLQTASELHNGILLHQRNLIEKAAMSQLDEPPSPDLEYAVLSYYHDTVSLPAAPTKNNAIARKLMAELRSGRLKL